jgi:hypothetical protein
MLYQAWVLAILWGETLSRAQPPVAMPTADIDCHASVASSIYEAPWQARPLARLSSRPHSPAPSGAFSSATSGTRRNQISIERLSLSGPVQRFPFPALDIAAVGQALSVCQDVNCPGSPGLFFAELGNPQIA